MENEDSKPCKNRPGPWHCYILHGSGQRGRNRTYVGKTNHMLRRLRQHNGKLAGGARATHKHRPHFPFIIVSGFPSEIAVLQFEWAMKHRRVRGTRGRSGRVRTLQRLIHLEQWTKRSPLMADLNLVVRTSLSHKQFLSALRKDDITPLHSPHVRYYFGQTVKQMVKDCTP